ISLNFPDFRAAERTFNLITQVSGRAGRGEKKGEVIIQTYNPSHYAIQCAKSQDYEDFFVREIRNRQNLRYPPFCRIVRLVVRGKDRERVFNYAYEIGDFIKSRVEGQKNISVLGPVSCPISRIKKNYRVHIIIKTDRISPVRNVLALLLNDEPKKYGVYLEIDFDPLSML
ncbi:MAG: primosomal protein N', partial [Spirochaetes bacterium]